MVDNKSSSLSSRTLFIISGVIALGSIAASIYLFLQQREASSRQKAIQDKTPNTPLEGKDSGETPEMNSLIRDYKAEADKIKQFTTYLYISGSLAGLSLISTLYFYKKEDKPAEDLEFEPASNAPEPTLIVTEPEVKAEPSTEPPSPSDNLVDTLDDLEEELITTSF